MNSVIGVLFSRYRTVLLTFFAIVVLGTSSYMNIPKSNSPDITIPRIYVSLHMDGISPADAEQTLVIPMETSLRTLPNIKSIKGSSYEGGGNITIEFDAGFDADTAYNDVKEKVDRVTLPDNANKPLIFEIATSDAPVLSIVLSGDLTNGQLIKIAEKLQENLESRQEILEANIIGSRTEILEIVIDPTLIENYNLNPTQIASVFKGYNQLVAAGVQEDKKGRFSIKVPGLINSADDVLNMPVLTDGNAQLRIRDIATIKPAFRERSSYARFNGDESVIIEIVKRTGENIVSTVKVAQYITEQAKESLPTGLKINYINDQSKGVRDILSDLQNTIMVAVILVMIIVVLAMGIRNGIMVGLAIPGAFLLTFLNLDIAGYTVNNIVLFALILSVGMVVDATVVIVEYADRCRMAGMRAVDSYISAVKTMMWPLISSSATTLAAFIPLLFFPGIAGEFMKFLPITLIIALSASLIMALVFIPILAVHFTTISRNIATIAVGVITGFTAQTIISTLVSAPTETSPSADIPPNAVQVDLGSVLAPVLAIILAIWAVRVFRQKYLNALIPIDNQNILSEKNKTPVDEIHDDLPYDLSKISGIQGTYIRFLDSVINRPRLVFTAIGVLMVASVSIYVMNSKGTEFFPTSEPESLTLNIRAEGNMSVYEKDAIVRQVENRVMQFAISNKDIKNLYTVAGHVGGKDGDKIGYIRIDLKSWDKRRKAEAIQNDLMKIADEFSGIYLETFIPQNGPSGGGKPINIEVRSESRATSREASQILATHLETNTQSKVIDLTNNISKPGIDWQLSINRQEAFKYNINIATLGTFIKFATSGVKLDSYRPENRNTGLDIIARFPRDYRTLEQIENLRISSTDGGIPISNFVIKEPIPKTAILYRSNSTPYYSIKADVPQGESVANAITTIQNELKMLSLPKGATIDFQGQNRESNEAQTFLSKAFFIAIGSMFVILLIQFNSFFQTALVLSTVVMSFTGIFWGLTLLNEPFGIVLSGIGIVSLAGIVVNNNIILLDTYNKLNAPNADHHRVVLVTCAQRLRPVLLTTITTVLGLMPTAFGLNFDFATRIVELDPPSIQWWKQMSVTIASGLTFSTILTLVMTPTLLVWRYKRNTQSNTAQS